MSTASGRPALPPRPAADEMVSFRQLYRYVEGWDWLILALAVLGSLGSGVQRPISTIIFGNILNGLSADGDVMPVIEQECISYCYLAAGAGAAGFLQAWGFALLSERLSNRLRQHYLEALLATEPGFYDSASSGDLVSRLAGDLVLFNLATGAKVGVLLQAYATFFAGLIIGLVQGWRLALVLLGFVPLLVTVGALTARWVAASTGREAAAYAKAGSLAQEVFSSIRTVAAFTGEPATRRRYTLALEETLRMGIMQKVVAGFGSGMMQFIMFVTYAVVLWYGTVLIRAGDLSGGDVITVFFSVMMGGSSLGTAAPSLDAIARGRGAAKKIYELIDRTPAIDARSPAGEHPATCVGELELRELSFVYSARPDAPIFTNLSLRLPAGRMTALVGESGSGKSTIIQLIMRFYDPTAGGVFLDGRDLRSLNVEWLRRQVGLVSQEPVLFATTLAENLRYGRPNATQTQLEEACRAANAHGFISTMVDGYETYVGERGLQLSGGQKQRIAIARAVLRDPRVLLLDEATSALDNESERVVQAALDNVRASSGRTTIAVAHRLSTIREADAIVVLRRGVVLEQGSHDELASRRDGAYAALLALQEHTPIANGASAAAAPPAEDATAKAKPSAAPTTASALSMVAVNVAASDAKSAELKADKASDDVSGSDSGPVSDAPFWRLARLSLPEAHWFALGSMSSAAAGMFLPIFALFLARLLVVFYEPPGVLMARHSFFWCMMFGCLACSCLIITIVQNASAGMVGQNCVHRVRQLALAAALRQEVAYFDDPKNSSGALTARLSGDAALLRLLVSDGLFATVQNLSTFVTGVVIAFVGGWQLTLVMCGIMPLSGASYYLATKRLSALAGDTRGLYERATQIATDSVSNIRTVAAFGGEQRVLGLFRDALHGPLLAARQAALVGGGSQAFSQVMATLPPAFSFYIGGLFITHGVMDFQGVMQVFFALLMSAIGVSQVSAVTGDVGAARPAAAAVFQLLDRKPAIDSGDPGGLQPEKCAGQLELQHVAFEYPTRHGVTVFADLSLQVPAGRTLALVGESGSGKSTVVQLIMRFYDPDYGGVFIDGHDLRQLNVSWLRRQLGLVSQEPALFATSLADNIAFGADGASREKVQAAARAANADSFITALPDGYDTQVGERGVQLSGGQKQRIAIARAVLRDPRVLLLDEATSALDNESERVVQAALEQLMAGRTCVVVAHRLSTIRNAHSIAVLRRGVLLEQGSHAELLAKPAGAYAQLMSVRGDAT